MRSQVLRIACASTLAFASLAVCAAEPSPPPGPAPKPVEREEWLRLAPDGSLDDARRAWKQFKKTCDCDASRLDPTLAAFDIDEGALAGHWELRYYDGNDLRAALHMQFPATPPYWTQVRVLCGRDEAACTSVRGELARMSAPRPVRNELLEDWRRVLMNERCEPGLPVRMDAPVYPREELRQGIHGKVTIVMVNNACGQVRDVWITKSTGNRNLDRAAVKAARNWVVKPFNDRGGTAQTDIVFTWDDPMTGPPPATP
jgi:TonB family protein